MKEKEKERLDDLDYNVWTMDEYRFRWMDL
jgi:hypothetical protein